MRAFQASRNCWWAGVGAAAAVALIAPQGWAADKTWIGGPIGRPDNDREWSPLGAPSTADNAVINTLSILDLNGIPWTVGKISVGNVTVTIDDRNVPPAPLVLDSGGLPPAEINVSRGGTLTVNTAVTLVNELIVNGEAGSTGRVDLVGSVSGNPIIVKSGIVALNGPNAHISTQIDGGKVFTGHVDALGVAAPLSIGDGHLELVASPFLPADVTVQVGKNARITENSAPVAGPNRGVGASGFGNLTFQDGASLFPPVPNADTTLIVDAGDNNINSAKVDFTAVNLNGALDTIDIAQKTTVVVTGAIADSNPVSGALVKTGAGTLELQGDSSAYQGGISVKAGQLVVGATGALGNNSIATETGSFTKGSSIISVNPAPVTPYRVGDIVSGPGIKAGSRIVAINGANLTIDTVTTAPSGVGATSNVDILRPDVAIASGASVELQNLSGVTNSSVSVGAGAPGATIILNSAPATPGTPEDYLLKAVNAGRDAVISVKPGDKVDVDLTTNPPTTPPLRNEATLSVASLTIDNSVTLNVENGRFSGTALRMTGAIEGDGGKLVKQGDGLLILESNASTYTGGTVIEAGTVRMGNDSVFGTGGVTVSGGALDVNGNTYNAGKSFTIGSAGKIFDSVGGGGIAADDVFDAPVATGSSKVELALSGTAELLKSGAGELVLAGAQQYTGRTIINDGKVTLSGALNAQGKPTAAADDTLVANRGIFLQGGVLNLGESTQHEGSADVVFGGGAVDAKLENGKIQKAGGNFVAAVGRDRTVTVEAILEARVGSVVGLEKKGQGTLILNGANSYNAGTVISEGTVQVGNSGALGSGNIQLGGGALTSIGTVRLGGSQAIRVSADSTLGGGSGQLEVAGTTTIDTSKTLTAGSGLTLDGLVTGGGALVVDASVGTVTVNNQGNNYTGGTTVKSGKLVVGGANALSSGGVILAGGELSLGADQTPTGTVLLQKGTVSGVGKLNASTRADVGLGNQVTVAGNNLKGALTKDGQGTVVLNGTNTELNGITLLDGVLELGADQSTGGPVVLNKGAVSGAGKISSANITAAVAAGDVLSVGDNLAGSFTKDGDGTLELNGTNTGLDNVTLKQGRIAGSGKLTAANGVSANVGVGKTVTVAGDNLKGAFTKVGDGTVELSSSNTELTNLTLAGGELSLGADQTPTGAVLLQKGTVSGVGKLNASTRADVGLGNQVTVAGNNLKGALTKDGQGTVVLNGTNTELNGITLSDGVLQVGADQSTGGPVALNKGTVSGPGTLTSTHAQGIVVENTSDVNISAGLSGANGLTKKDTGTLVLSGDNTGLNGLAVEKGTVKIGQQKSLGSGLVTVGDTAKLDAGGLEVTQASASMVVNGELAAKSLTVGAGQTLSGAGRVAADVKLAGGAVAPGNSPGTITIAGLSGNGDYLWERNDQIALGAGAIDLTNITVRPRAGGAVVPVTGLQSLAHDQVQADPSRSLKYAQIFSGTIPATAGLPRFEGADTAVIKIRMVRSDNPSAPGIDLVVDRSSYAEFGRGKSGKAFGAYLDSQLSAHYGQSSSEIGRLLRNLDATAGAGDVSAYLRAVDPGAAYASLYNVGLRRAHTAAIPLEDRLDLIGSAGATDSALQLAANVGSGASKMTAPFQQQDDGSNWTAWTSGQSSVLRTNAKSDFGTIQSSDNGASLGMEHQIGGLRIGGLASFGQGSATFGSPALRVESDHWHVGGYGSVAFGAVTVDASALFGSSDESSKRSVAAGSARGNFGSTDTQVGVGVALNLIPKTSGWQVTPVARLKYVSYKQDAFAESGPGGALLFNPASISEDTVLSKVGFRVAHSSEVSKSFKLGLDGAAYWVHDFNSEGRNMALALQGATGAFQATGRNGQANTAQLNLGVQAILADSVTVRLSGQQEVGANRYQSTGVFAVGWNF